MYPNPTNSILNIATNAVPDACIIRDIQGKICLESEATEALNIESLKPGLYIIELQSKQTIGRKTWVKE